MVTVLVKLTFRDKITDGYLENILWNNFSATIIPTRFIDVDLKLNYNLWIMY